MKKKTVIEIETLKQQSRELTKSGKIEQAARVFNAAWDLEHGFRRGYAQLGRIVILTKPNQEGCF